MAAQLPPEFDQAFGNLEFKTPDASDPVVNSASNQNGLSPRQRVIVQSVFDTQPERRRSYMKQLGYELSTDGKAYRPIGVDSNYTPIEEENFQPFPGQENFQPIPYFKLLSEKGISEVVKEIGLDAGDITFDMLVTGPAVSGGSVLGMAEGGAKGAGVGGTIGGLATGGPGVVPGAAVGGVVGSIGGLVAGASGGYVASEAIKTGIGDLLLDETVPMDLRETAYQTLMVGGISVLAKGGVEALKKLRQVSAKDLYQGAKELVRRKLGGNAQPEIVEAIIKNPENFTPAALGDTSRSVNNVFDEIFGTSAENPKSTRDLTGGIARGPMDSLNKQADAEIQKLAANRDADFAVDDIVQIIKERTDPIANQRYIPAEEQKVLDFFKDEVTKIKDGYRKLGPDGKPLRDAAGELVDEFDDVPFDQTRKILKGWNNQFWEKGGKLEGNPIAKGVSHDLKNEADKEAAKLGSQLPEINAKRSEALKTYKLMREHITRPNLESAFVGRDGTKKDLIRQVLGKADEVFGTRMSEAVETVDFKHAVKKAFDDPRNFSHEGEDSFANALRAGLRRGRNDAILTGTAVAPLAAMGGLKPAAAITVAAGARGAIKGIREELKSNTPDVLLRNVSRSKLRLSNAYKSGMPDKLGGGYLDRVLDPIGQGATQAGKLPTQLTPLAPEAASPTPQAASLPPEFNEAFPDLDAFKLPQDPGDEPADVNAGP